MHVRIRCYGVPDRIVLVESKLMKIERLKQAIEDKFNIAPQIQKLFYGGKLLENNCTLYDYNIKFNDVIQLMTTEQLPCTSENTTSKQQNTKETYTDAESILYELEDLVDVKHKIKGMWQEGKIIRIVHDTKRANDGNNELSHGNHDLQNNQADVQIGESSTKEMNNELTNSCRLKTTMPLLYKIQLDNDQEEYYEESQIRPRARTVLDIEDIKVGLKVMVNYNIDIPDEKGYWYDFKVEKIRRLKKMYQLVGILYLGTESVPQSNTRIKSHDKIYAIEEAVPVAQRTEQYKIVMKTQPEKRSKPIYCYFCRDNDTEPCRECGCSVCSSKEEPGKIVLCDECNKGFHMDCLQPAMTELPAGDWYCQNCARDTTAVVAPGASSQPRKKVSTSRDWGRGMACVGKTKTCMMPANHFGPIPGVEVGMCWRFRIQLSESGVHRPPVSGIHGRDVVGAFSIVLSGGYEDDVDNGNEFTYTGSGGRDLSGNKRTAEQSCDQKLVRENRALACNCAAGDVSEAGGDAGDAWQYGKPVRVVRSYKMLRHFPKYAPREGMRYDGIYKVVKYYQETGLSGFKVWKYLLRRDDPSPAPWERGAKEFPVIYPDGYLEAEADKKALRAKNVKTAKSNQEKIRLSRNKDKDVADGFEEPSTSTKPKRKGKKRLHPDNKSSDPVSEETSLSENVANGLEGPSTLRKSPRLAQKEPQTKIYLSPDSVSGEVFRNENLAVDSEKSSPYMRRMEFTKKRALPNKRLLPDLVSEEMTPNENVTNGSEEGTSKRSLSSESASGKTSFEENVVNISDDPSSSRKSVILFKKRALLDSNVSESVSKKMFLDENVTNSSVEPPTSWQSTTLTKKRPLPNDGRSSRSVSKKVSFNENVANYSEKPSTSRQIAVLKKKKTKGFKNMFLKFQILRGILKEKTACNIEASSTSGRYEETSDKNPSPDSTEPPCKKRKLNSERCGTYKIEGLEEMNNSLIIGYNPKKVRNVLTDEEKKVIEADTLNMKKWAECLAAPVRGRQEFIDVVTQTFICIICRDTVENPVTTECLHNFCLRCLRMAYHTDAGDESRPCCAYCRTEFKSPPNEADINISLRTALRTIMPGYDGFY